MHTRYQHADAEPERNEEGCHVLSSACVRMHVVRVGPRLASGAGVAVDLTTVRCCFLLLFFIYLSAVLFLFS